MNAHIFPGPAIIYALKSAAADSILEHNQCVRTEISADDKAGDPEFDMLESMNEGRRRSSVNIISTTTIETRVEPSTATGRTSAKGDSGGSLGPSEIPLDRGLILLAEMSSEGSLLTGAYTEQCVSLAREHREFVIGFIAQHSLNSEPEDNFITFTPGVSLPSVTFSDGDVVRGDGLGQQYNSPRRVVLEHGSDVVIVGRGILNADDPAKETERYRQEAWSAYEARLAG